MRVTDPIQGLMDAFRGVARLLVEEHDANHVHGGRRGVQRGPTVWITQRAGSRPAVVATAWPTFRPLPYRLARRARHSSRIAGPFTGCYFRGSTCTMHLYRSLKRVPPAMNAHH